MQQVLIYTTISVLVPVASKMPGKQSRLTSVSFIFTNAFLSMKYFQKGKDYKHLDFKIAFANEMVNATGISNRSSTARRSVSTVVEDLSSTSSVPVKIQELAKNGKVKLRFCHACKHRRNPKRS